MTPSRREEPNLVQPRVVLDTNVVLSALVFGGGTTAALRYAWQSQRFAPLASKETVQELARVLAYPKFGLIPGEQEDLLSDYLPFCVTVVVVDSPSTPPCRDPFDKPFLELALAGAADFLVTGDEDLLSLAGEFSCPIITVTEILV